MPGPSRALEWGAFVAFLIAALGWREGFYLLGRIGLVWAMFWWRWFRDEPALHPSVTPAELQEIQTGFVAHTPTTSLKSLLSLNLVVLCVP